MGGFGKIVGKPVPLTDRSPRSGLRPTNGQPYRGQDSALTSLETLTPGNVEFDNQSGGGLIGNPNLGADKGK